MLEKMISEGYGNSEDYNCAEKVLYGANEGYGLGMDHKTLKVAAGFGGGMGTGRICGAVAASVMVLGVENTETVAHQSPEVREMVIGFQETFAERMGSVNCCELRDKYWSDEAGCTAVIEAAAQLLDETRMRLQK